jgi:prolyl-tRNA editing enzyme YbaK/EbsC (Cys-tRNA(Pro) deacylase)
MNHELLDPQVKESISTHKIEAKAIACDPDFADTAAFCEKYGYSPGDSANTIIIASRTEPVIYVACLVLASTKLDVNRTLRRLVGTRKLSFATADQTKALTGMLIGGVTIFGLHDMPIYVDKAVMERTEIIVGGGNRSSKLVLSPNELNKLPGMQVVEGLGIVRQ